MTGSLLGRCLLAVPALLAAVGVGIVLVGVTSSVAVGLGSTVALAAAGGLRAAQTGVTIDLDRQQIVLRGFWRTHRVEAAALERVDALGGEGEGSAAGVRFQLRDGREIASLSLAYLTARPAAELVADLRALTVQDPFEVAITPRSFRRAAG